MNFVKVFMFVRFFLGIFHCYFPYCKDFMGLGSGPEGSSLVMSLPLSIVQGDMLLWLSLMCNPFFGFPMPPRGRVVCSGLRFLFEPMLHGSQTCLLPPTTTSTGVCVSHEIFEAGPG